MLWFYHNFAVDGPNDWVNEQPELRQLYAQVLGSVDREQQQALIRQMERHIHDQAYFLFLYNPIKLYAVNKAVEFVDTVVKILYSIWTGQSIAFILPLPTLFPQVAHHGRTGPI